MQRKSVNDKMIIRWAGVKYEVRRMRKREQKYRKVLERNGI